MITVVCAYAPTLDANDIVKENVYAALDQVIVNTPNGAHLLILGNGYACVGSEHEMWTPVGYNRIGKINPNGQLLLTKCTGHNVLITNTQLQMKKKQHPRSKHWHQIDFIITKSRDQKEVKKAWAIIGSDSCSTDHYLLKCEVIISPERR